MTRINLMPGPSIDAPAVAARAMPKLTQLRKRRPLNKRELLTLFKRIMDRVLTQGSAGPFAVFAIRKGQRGRVFQLIGIKSPDFEVQMRRACVLHHWVGTYDGNADPQVIWEDLCAFDTRSK